MNKMKFPEILKFSFTFQASYMNKVHILQVLNNFTNTNIPNAMSRKNDITRTFSIFHTLRKIWDSSNLSLISM